MTENNDVQECLNCGNSEQQIPLVSIRFDGKGDWICSQCLPTLIHHPQQLAGKLSGIDTIQIQTNDH